MKQIGLFKSIGPQQFVGIPIVVRRKIDLDKFNDVYINGVRSSLKRRIRDRNIYFPIIKFIFDRSKLNNGQLAVMLWIQKQLTNCYCLPYDLFIKNEKWIKTDYWFYSVKGLFLYVDSVDELAMGEEYEHNYVIESESVDSPHQQKPEVSN